MRRAVRIAWYRFQATFRQRWTGYLSVVLLIGLVGGVAMAAVAAARRTQSSFPAYLASTNPSDLDGGTAIFDPSVGSSTPYDAKLVATIAHLPHVKATATYTGFNPEIVPLKAFHVHGHLPAGEQPAGLVGTTDGALSRIDRSLVIHGRSANPARVDEILVTPGEARALGIRVGSIVPIGVFTNAQVQLPDCCSAHGAIKPYGRVNLKVVGIIVPNRTVVQDDVEALGSELVLFTPAFTREFRTCCAYYSDTLVQLDRGSADLAAVTAELGRLSPRFGLAFIDGFKPTRSTVLAKAERAIEPESIALGVFGAIAALAALFIAAQMIGRQVRAGADDGPSCAHWVVVRR